MNPNELRSNMGLMKSKGKINTNWKVATKFEPLIVNKTPYPKRDWDQLNRSMEEENSRGESLINHLPPGQRLMEDQNPREVSSKGRGTTN